MDIFNQICRSCNNERKKMLNIFETKLLAKTIPIQVMLSCCGQERIRIDDKYPKQICYLCAKQLEISYKFLLQYNKSIKQFDQILEYLAKCPWETDCEQMEDSNEADMLSNQVLNALDDVSQEQETSVVSYVQDSPHHKFNETSMITLGSCIETQDNIQNSDGADDIRNPLLECTSNKKDNDTNEMATKFSCAHCSKSFFTVKALILHRRISHKIKVKSEDKQDFCDNCGEFLKNINSLVEHKKSCKINKSMHNCTKCSKIFMGIIKFQQHSNQCFK